MASPRASLFVACCLAAGLSVNLAASCADGDTVDPGFSDLSGGAGGDGGSGQGGTTQAVTSGNTTGSSSPTTATGPGATTGGSTVTTGTGMECMDTGPGEPNDNEASAFSLGTIGDSDGDGGSVPGVLSDGDVDWYVYNGQDNFGSVVDPTREFSSSQTLRVCKFIECPDNDQNFSCPGGTVPETSPNGRQGCCNTMGFEVGDFICGSSSLNDDSATVYIRIDDPTGQAMCASYTLNYHF
jgi:hypothetical protein